MTYTYVFGEKMHSGELRKWVMPKKTSRAEIDPATVEFSERFPNDAEIRVRVDPQQPGRSVPDILV